MLILTGRFAIDFFSCHIPEEEDEFGVEVQDGVEGHAKQAAESAELNMALATEKAERENKKMRRMKVAITFHFWQERQRQVAVEAHANMASRSRDYTGEPLLERCGFGMACAQHGVQTALPGFVALHAFPGQVSPTRGRCQRVQ